MRVLAYDTETNGLDLHYGKRMFAFSTCSPGGMSRAWRLSRGGSTAYLKRLFGERAIVKVMHNAKFDLTATEYQLGRRVAETTTFHDTILMSHVLQNLHPTHRLKDLSWELAGIPKDDEKAVKAFTRGGGDYSMVPEWLMKPYQRLDAERCMLLHLFFYPKIQANKQYLEIYEMERDLVIPTIRMEQHGLMVNRRSCEKLIGSIEQDIEVLLDEIEVHAGKRINPNKPADVRWLLFVKSKLPARTRTAITKEIGTQKSALLELKEEFKHPAVDMILKHRSWERGTKILQSYLDLCDGNDIIHPNIRTCGAKTGRESCSRPNLQNVAKSKVLLNPFPIPARLAFRPRPGCVNVHIDYAGIEMRILVHYSGEQVLVAKLRLGEDVHEPACYVFYGDRFRNAVGGERKMLRDASKNANFSIPYGSSAKKVSNILSMPFSEGSRRYIMYRHAFPDLCALNQQIARQVRECGYVTTIFGRKLYVPRQKAYMGTNYLVQGTAAGILKRAQIRVHWLLEALTGGECCLLLPIHDEVVLEVPRTRLKDFTGNVYPKIFTSSSILLSYNSILASGPAGNTIESHSPFLLILVSVYTILSNLSINHQTIGMS